MRRIILLLFWLQVVASATTTTTDPSETTETPSSDAPKPKLCSGIIIPGLEKMTRGVDVTSLELFPMNLQQFNGFRKTVLQLTCDDARTWQNPSDVDKTDYQRPDQVAGISTIPAGYLDTKTDFSSDSTEFKQTRALKIGLEVDAGVYGAYSASTGLKEVLENIYRGNRSVAETSSTVSSYLVDFTNAPHLPLTQNFDHFLRYRLTQPFEAAPRLYAEFIETFGTHYFDMASFGGYLYQRSLIENEFLMNSEETEIKVNLEASFGSRVKATAEAEQERKKITEHFKSSSRTSFNYYGGIPVEMDPHNPGSFMERWVPLVNKDPWLFGGVLKPLEDLIVNRTIRAEVVKATSLHKARAYLAELKMTLEMTNYRMSYQDRELVRDLETKLQNDNWAGRNVTALVKKIDEFLQIIEFKRARNKLHPLSNDLFDFRSRLHCAEDFILRRFPWGQILPDYSKQYKELNTKIEILFDRLDDLMGAEEKLKVAGVVPFAQSVNRMLASFREDSSDAALAFMAKSVRMLNCKSNRVEPVPAGR